MEIFSFSTPRCEKITPSPFNELILSWNGFRPRLGRWSFYISLFQTQWSPFLKYAEWGPSSQKTFQSSLPDSNACSYQDVVSLKTGYATAFRIDVRPEEGADLSTLHVLHVFCADTSKFLPAPIPTLPSLRLYETFPHSQMTLPHPRRRDLCSPSSTTAAINFLLKKNVADPLAIAAQVHDSGFDIYGNWILNTAAAYEALDGNYQTLVARLPNFSAVHAQLAKNLPVVLSVKGTLPGAKIPYPSGHLILVIGYDGERREVLCMDPAFDSDPETFVSYPIEPFLQAWKTRRHLAYLFLHKQVSKLT
jgi:hypothetical protein